jgi:hypothetical protein
LTLSDKYYIGASPPKTSIIIAYPVLIHFGQCDLKRRKVVTIRISIGRWHEMDTTWINKNLPISIMLQS